MDWRAMPRVRGGEGSNNRVQMGAPTGEWGRSQVEIPPARSCSWSVAVESDLRLRGVCLAAAAATLALESLPLRREAGRPMRVLGGGSLTLPGVSCASKTRRRSR